MCSASLSEADRLAALRSYDMLDTACEAAFDNIVQLAAEMTGSPISFVTLIDAERGWVKARHGLDVTEIPREHAFCSNAIAAPAGPLIVHDLLADPRFADNPLVVGAPNIRFYAGVPLINPEGAALGTLCVLDQRPRELTRSQHNLLERLAETVMTTFELRRVMTQVRRLALIDTLTGLPNRPALFAAVDAAIAVCRRSGDGFAVIYMDLDGFKGVNDQYGHAAGDAVLRLVAATLTACIREDDLAARLGGDEFAIVLPGTTAEALPIAERIRASLVAGMRGNGWNVTASIGLALFQHPPGCSDEAIAAADSQMYRAKSGGKDCVRHRAYTPQAPL